MKDNETSNETIPKSVRSEQVDLTMSAKQARNKHQVQVERLNKDHSCMPAATRTVSHRKRVQSAEQKLQFIDSLSAPRRLFDNVTVEPLAFLAMLALSIEFSSIQDLFYTKICLQVVANEPNSTFNLMNQTSTSQMLILDSMQDGQIKPTKGNLSNVTIELLNSFPENKTTSQLLATSGRIQHSTTTTSGSAQQVPNHSQLLSRDHSLCDRMNKGAVPSGIRQKIAEDDSLFWLKYQLIICFLCSLSSPYWGGMSDRIGRVIPLNMSILASTINNFISLAFGLLISLDSHNLFNLDWLNLGAVLVGLSGGQAVLIVSTFSFISDHTSSENRSKRIAILESVIYLSHSAGFYLSKHVMSLSLASPERPWLNRHVVAFSTCLLLNISCLLYSTLKLRHHKFHKFLNNFEREQQETVGCDVTSSSSSFGTVAGSLEKICDKNGRLGEANVVINSERLRELTSSTPDDLDGPIARADKSFAGWGTILTFKYYKQTYLTATKRRESRGLILSMLFCGFISAMSLASLMSLLYTYLHTDPFNWSTSQYSSWNSKSYITRGAALVSLTFCMRFLKCWNVPDPIVAAVGFLSKGVGLVVIALAKTSSVIDWALLAFVLSELSMPPLRSLLSKLVAKEEVGKIYSCLAAAQSICFLAGNVLFYLAYTSLDLHNFFRLSFLIVASFQFVAVVIMLFTYSTLRHRIILV